MSFISIPPISENIAQSKVIKKPEALLSRRCLFQIFLVPCVLKFVGVQVLRLELTRLNYSVYGQ